MALIEFPHLKKIFVLALAVHILKLEPYRERLAWPLCKDDTQIREAFHIFIDS